MTRSRVLFVDDNATVRAAAKSALEVAGYDATVATDGNAALLFLIANTPDAIVVDEHMPRLDGPALISSIRSVDRLRNVALVLASERRTTLAQKARDLAVRHTLPKPFSPAAIAAVLSKALEERARTTGDRYAVETVPSLVGRLDHVRLRDVVGLLRLTEQSGLLEVSSDDAATVRIWLRRGAIDLATIEIGRPTHDDSRSDPRLDLSLARFLLDGGATPEMLDSVVNESDRALATALVRRHVVSSSAVRAAMAAQSREIVRDTLGRTTGKFRFLKNAQSDEAEDARLDIDPTALLDEAPTQA